MDLRATRDRLTTAYRTRSEQARSLVDRIPILGRLVSEFVRIELIDRCLLIAAQGLLALIPTFVVLVAFFPHLTDVGLSQFSDATGLGSVMPTYVESSAEQFGTLGVILAISTWLIGFGAILVGSALVGRVVSEDPTVLRVVSSTASVVQGARAVRPRAGGPPPPPAR